MKRIGIVLIMMLTFGLAACKGGTNEADAIKEFTNSITTASSYELKGEMEVKKASSAVTFTMEVSYKAPALYKVIYINKANNSRQVLLKNSEGVYVLSPELNKEFKFESNWPLNSSHIYILNRVAEDLLADKDATVKTEGDYYVINSKITHKIRTDLETQSIYLSKEDYSLSKITYNSTDDTPMTLNVSKIDYGISFKSNAFDVNAIMESEASIVGEGSLVPIESVYFANIFEDVALQTSTTSEEYTILSYTGAKNYYIIYQDVNVVDVSTVTRIYDDFVLLDNSIGLVASNSLTFYVGDKEFKIISSSLTLEEKIQIANSLEFN